MVVARWTRSPTGAGPTSIADHSDVHRARATGTTAKENDHDLRCPDPGDTRSRPDLAIGLGGRRAGLGRDVAYRLLPLTDVDARELIDASESLSIQLDGFRGSVPLDRLALQQLILRFAALLRAVPELVEVDLNPVRCLPDGALVLDMRLRVERRSRAEWVTRW